MATLSKIRLIYGFDDVVAKWVAERIEGETYKDYRAIGVADVEQEKLIAGVVYHRYYGHDISMSVAASDTRWARPAIIGELLAFPFVQLNVTRVTAVCANDNDRIKKFIKGLGFQLEGQLRLGWDGEQDAIVFGMLLEDARRWLEKREITHG